MKKIICTKPLTLGGKNFVINDEVPVELIAPNRIEALKRYGQISVKETEDTPADAKVTVKSPDKAPANRAKPTSGRKGASKK